MISLDESRRDTMDAGLNRCSHARRRRDYSRRGCLRNGIIRRNESSSWCSCPGEERGASGRKEKRREGERETEERKKRRKRTQQRRGAKRANTERALLRLFRSHSHSRSV